MTNQFLKDSVLFKSQGSPITELAFRDKLLCLYTEDNELLHRLKSWKQMLWVIDYTNQDNKGREHLIAADLYFLPAAKNALLKALHEQTHSREKIPA